MYVMCVSLNYHQLPVAVREQFAFASEDLPQANQLLNTEKSILENAILSTCNRTEVYAVVDQIHTGRYYIKRFLANWFHTTVEDLTAYATIQVKEAAVGHLLTVATGLDSLIKGEPQILGQVKTAYFTANDSGSTGVILDHLFREAITFAKRMHTDYRVSEFSQTSPQAALHQIKTTLGTVKGKQVAILGVGEMGLHAARNASTMGFKQVVILNRTDEKAQALADQTAETVVAAPWAERTAVIGASDAVILATGAKRPIVGPEELAAHLDPADPFVLVDLGVPRNAAIDALPPTLTYYDIDHLTAIISANDQKKATMLQAMADAVAPEVAAFFAWQQTLHIVPVMRALREHALAVEGTAYDSLLRKLPELDAHERKVISKHMKSVVNQMIKGPIKEIKELSTDPDATTDIEFFCRIFGLQDLVPAHEEHSHEK